MSQVTQKQFEALAGFRVALRRFLAFSDAAAAEAGITTQQYQVLLAIKAHAKSRITVGELADELLLTSSAAVQLVDRVVKLGFVERQTAANDRRSTQLVLTDSGEMLLHSLAARHLEQLGKRKKQISDLLAQLKRARSLGNSKKLQAHTSPR